MTGIIINYETEILRMAKRVTIMLDDDLIKKPHEIQAKKIKETTESVSFSKVLNEQLALGMKKK